MAQASRGRARGEQGQGGVAYLLEALGHFHLALHLAGHAHSPLDLDALIAELVCAHHALLQAGRGKAARRGVTVRAAAARARGPFSPVRRCAHLLQLPLLVDPLLLGPARVLAEAVCGGLRHVAASRLGSGGEGEARSVA